MAQVTMEQAETDIAINLEINRSLLFVGPVGVGKTTLLRSACKLRELKIGRPFPYLEFRASTMDPTDLSMPFPDAATGRMRQMIADWLPREDRDGPEGLICFDEFTDAQLGVQAVLNQVILEKKYLPAGWRVAATGNRMVDRAAANPVSRASANRFAILEAVVDWASSLAWFKANMKSPELVAFLMQAERESKGATDMLHSYPVDGGRDAQAFRTPRSWAACDPYFALGLTDTALRRNIAHNVGKEGSDALMAFLATWRLASQYLAAILADPASAPLHREPSTNYALCVGLVSNLTMANLPVINIYISRLDALYRAAFWSLAKSKDKAFEETTEHVQYLIAQSNSGL